MEPGQMIRVRAYGGEILVRKVVQRDKDTVIVCTAEEYDKARSEGRNPTCVGFHIKYVLDDGSK